MRLFSDSSPPSSQASPASFTPSRKLIRCKATRASLTKEGTWTSEIGKACAFPHISAPHAATSQFPEQELEVYYSFEADQPSRFDFTLRS